MQLEKGERMSITFQCFQFFLFQAGSTTVNDSSGRFLGTEPKSSPAKVGCETWDEEKQGHFPHEEWRLAGAFVSFPHECFKWQS